MLSKYKNGTRILSGYVALLAVLVTVGITAAVNIRSINAHTEHVAGLRAKQVSLAYDLAWSMTRQVAHARGYVLFRDQSLADEYEQESQRFRERAQTLKRLTKDPAELDVLEKAVDGEARYARLFNDRILPAVRSGAISSRDATLGEMAKTAKITTSACERFLDGATKDMAASRAAAVAAGRAALIAISLLTVLGIAAGVFVALAITRSITTPVNQLVDDVNRIAEGDLSVQLQNRTNDEVGTLARSVVETLAGTLRELIAEMNRMSSEHNAGDIDVVVDVDKFTGAYREMAGGINDMVAAHITVKKKAMACIAEFGKGNFEAPLDRFPGKKAFINDTIEQMRSNLKALIDDANMLAGAAVEGRLDTRADAERHGGDFRKIVQGVNDTLDSVLGPVNEAADVLARIAGNDLTARVTGDYQGDHARIKHSVNTAADTLEQSMVQVKASAERVTASAQALTASAEELGKGAQQIAQTIEQVAAGSQEQSRTAQAGSLAMEQLTRAIQEVADGSQSQARTVEETVTLIQQITYAIEQVSSLSQEAAATGSQVADVATTGGHQVQEAVAAMDRIKDATDRVADMVRQLGESSQQIGAIVETIDDIAEQTNLLALNAAIEAARAGEHGKGFAVVADEVRKLAERSSKATGEIAELIGEIRTMTDHAVGAMETSSSEVAEGTSLGRKAGEALSKIQDAVSSVARQIEDMSAAAQQMNSSSSEVVRAIESVSAITEESTSSAQEMAAGSSEVSVQIQQVAAVSEENAAASEEVSATVEEQNAAVEEMTASANELSSMALDLQTLVDQFVLSDADRRTLGSVTEIETRRSRRKAA